MWEFKLEAIDPADAAARGLTLCPVCELVEAERLAELARRRA